MSNNMQQDDHGGDREQEEQEQTHDRSLAAPEEPEEPEEPDGDESALFSAHMCRSKFVELADALITAFKDLFPECKRTKSVHRKFKTVVLPFPQMQSKFIETWHEEMCEFYDSIRSGSLLVLLGAPNAPDMVERLHLRQKVDDPRLRDDPESMKQLLTYLTSLNTYANAYFLRQAMPEPVSAFADEITSDLIRHLKQQQEQQHGSGSDEEAAMVNPMMMMQMAMQMVQRIDHEQLATWAEAMSSNPRLITAVMHNASGFMYH